MKFTVDIDKQFNESNIQDWKNAHYATIKILAEMGVFYEIHESAHGRMHMDFELHSVLPIPDILVMRLALGDDFKRIRNDATRYFLNVTIDQWLPGLKEINERRSIKELLE